MVKCYGSVDDLAQGLCEWFENAVDKELRIKQILNIAFSGGSTPAAFFEKLALSRKIKWNRLHIYWVDERCVGPEHNDSNYGMTVKYLFDNICIHNNQVHRIIGENNPEREVKRYAADILANVPMKDEIPEFDFVLLGIGSDGHTASIFPDRPDLLKSDEICAVVKHPETGQLRITITGKVILNARQLIFLASGSSKQKIIREVLEEPELNETKYPAAFIAQNHSGIYWFLDNKAAENLMKKEHD